MAAPISLEFTEHGNAFVHCPELSTLSDVELTEIALLVPIVIERLRALRSYVAEERERRRYLKPPFSDYVEVSN